MPIGSFTVVPFIANRIARARPARVLDVGMGFGMNGVLVRQWVDLGVQPWKTHLTGVEVHEPYRNPVWSLYDQVYLGMIQDYLADHYSEFDAIFFGDVIEHMSKPEGRRVLAGLQQRLARGGELFVATPANFFEQGEVYGNPYEAHVSHWIPEEFLELGFRLLLTGREPQEAINKTILAHWQRP